MQRPPQRGSFWNTWYSSGVIPDRVFPEPVSPVISQPRQKSSRVHVSPFNRTIGRWLVRREVAAA
jgi:hypothetical protein